MIHANLRYKTLGYLLAVLKSGRRVTTEEVKSEHIPVEQKRHKKHDNDHWRLLKGCKLIVTGNQLMWGAHKVVCWNIYLVLNVKIL